MIELLPIIIAINFSMFFHPNVSEAIIGEINNLANQPASPVGRSNFKKANSQGLKFDQSQPGPVLLWTEWFG